MAKAATSRPARRRADTSNVTLSPVPGVPDTAGVKPDDLAPATSDDLEASGAIMEPGVKARIDTDHPAVDNAPRAGQPKIANQIDFNDPGKSAEDAVADNLKAQD